VVRERDFRLVADRVMDLSPGGALVGPADPVLTGERVIVSFPGVDGGWVDAEAVVARVVHGRRRGEYTRSLGLSFDALDPESERALARFLTTRLPKAPGQRCRAPASER
jgi:c-di-GMP-binding flagellar brake protein YcgR